MSTFVYHGGFWAKQWKNIGFCANTWVKECTIFVFGIMKGHEKPWKEACFLVVYHGGFWAKQWKTIGFCANTWVKECTMFVFEIMKGDEKPWKEACFLVWYTSHFNATSFFRDLMLSDFKLNQRWDIILFNEKSDIGNKQNDVLRIVRSFV